MQAGEDRVKEHLKERLLDLSSIMKLQEISGCNTGQCYWADPQGNKQYGSSMTEKEKREKRDYGAWVIWKRAADNVAAYLDAIDVPTPAIAFKEVQREVLAPPCCAQCGSELRTLLRIVRGVAAERKLL